MAVDTPRDALAAWLERRERELALMMLERMERDGPTTLVDLSLTGPLAETALESSVAGLRHAALGLRSGRSVGHDPPPLAVEEAVRAARARVPWQVLSRSYRLGQAVIQEQALAELLTWHLTDAERLDAAQALSRYLFAYVDDMLETLHEVYEAERDRVLHAHEYQRTAWIRDVLSGGTTTADVGAHPLQRHHLGLVAWGDGAIDAVRDLAASTSARTASAPGEGNTVWTWLSTATPPSSTPEELASRTASAVRDATIAFGSVAYGIEGFRLTHWQAIQAARVARRIGRNAAYDEFTLETLTLRDETAAQRFVEHELGPLLEPGERNEALLDTLRTYFDSGLRGAAAARRLALHERTVGYRLSTVERRLGRRLVDRQPQLAAALRLEAMLRRAPIQARRRAEAPPGVRLMSR